MGAIEISADDARHLALRAQGLAGARDARAGVGDLLRRLGAVQLDTISVLARSHELVPYARLGAVGRAPVEDAFWGRPARAFEYYAHANCVLPVEAWPLFAFRRRGLRGRRRHSVAERSVREVRARLRDGPVTATDVGGARAGPGGWWNWSAEKNALETLYYRGDAVCATRRGWKRVYDLPERALPAHVLGREPSDAECYRELVRLAGRALGVATRRDVADYFRLTTVGAPAARKRLLDAALAESDLVPVRVEGWEEPAYADPTALRARARARPRTTLLSPFDSLVWYRARTERLFGFEMRLEAYKPRPEREHGYFAMPLLSDGRLAGRVDPAREGPTLVARAVSLVHESAAHAMAEALREAAEWVGCDAVRVERVRPARAAGELRRALKG
jgi:uncharacterized protein YcaQ